LYLDRQVAAEASQISLSERHRRTFRQAVERRVARESLAGFFLRELGDRDGAQDVQSCPLAG